MSDMMQEFKFVPGYDKVDCKKLFTMSTTVLVVLSVIGCGTSTDAVPRWVCHSMACTVGVHFCSPRTRRCEPCEDYKTSCSTQFQAQNCTSYCMDIAVTLEVAINLEKKRIAYCPALDPIPHGSHNATQAQPHLAVVAYSCDGGYQSSANVREVQCGDYGMWSGQRKCLAIFCPAPTSPENGFIGPENQVVDENEEGYAVNVTLPVQCNEGFYLAGRNTTTCREDGRWDLNKIPPCYPSEPAGIDPLAWLVPVVVSSLSTLLCTFLVVIIINYTRRRMNHHKGSTCTYDLEDSETTDSQLYQNETTLNANYQRNVNENANKTGYSEEHETSVKERLIPAEKTDTTQEQTGTGHLREGTTKQPTGAQTMSPAITVNVNVNTTANADANGTVVHNPTGTAAKADDTDEPDPTDDRPKHEDLYSTQEVGNTIPIIGSEGSDYRDKGVGSACAQLPVMKSQEGDQGHIPVVGAAQPDDNESDCARKIAMGDGVLNMDDLGN